MNDGKEKAVLALDVGAELWGGWGDVVLVVGVAVAIYAVVLLLARIAGARSLGHYSSFDVAVSMAIGSIIGRLLLVHVTLVAAVVGLAALFGLQATIRFVRDRGHAGWVDPDATMIVWQGLLLDENLREVGLAHRDLIGRLRLAGVARLGDVEAAVLERTGEVSVVRRGESIEPEMLADVHGVPANALESGR